MTLGNSLFVASLIALACATGAAASPPETPTMPPGGLSLDQCVSMALERNLGVMAAKMLVGGAGERVKSARTDFFPRLDVVANYGYLSSEVLSSSDPGKFRFEGNDTHSVNLSLSQPLYTGGKLTKNLEKEVLGRDFDNADLETLRVDLRLRVSRAYYDVLSTENLKLVAQQSVLLLKELLREAAGLHGVGIAPKSDVLSAAVELADARQKLAGTESGVGIARWRLNTLLRLPLEDRLSLVEVFEYAPRPVDREQCETKALENRPDLRKLQVQASLAELDIGLVRSERRPALSLDGTYIIDNGGSLFGDRDVGGWGVSAGLRWNIVNWGDNRHREREARYLKDNRILLLRQQREAVLLEVREAISKLRLAEKNISTAAGAIGQAEESLRISRERYKASMTTSTEVREAETLLTQSRVNHTAALYDYNVGMAELEWTVGAPLP